MRSAEIHRRFLDHFATRGHEIVPSASLISDDPTLLLVNAGMVPFKPYFLGEQAPPWERATSVQKCVRTLDIDEVGKTTRHGSFFQMAGNFSFGDYFKPRAIELAWELLTKSVEDGGYGIDAERLWTTVYLDDDEAFDLWRQYVPEERIQRRGKADNFWHMGVPGPGGPCSEIYYDRGPDYGREGGPIADEDRYLELWNLVFMQVQLSAVRGKEDFDVSGPLPAQNIDTGMGVERVATVLQGVDNLYEIDTSRAILVRASVLTGTSYGADPAADVRLRVVADHARTSLMLLGDGVTPGNEGRGYVLRRIMRRTVRAMRLLGAADPTMGDLVGTAIEAMGPQYPNLVTDSERILEVAVGEEASFLETVAKGATLFEQAVPEARTGGGVLSGERAFQLHDTYGFPIDLTLEMAAEQGLAVDEDGFRRLMAEQRQRSKADRKAQGIGHADVSAYRTVLDDGGPTEFTGYVAVGGEAHVRAILGPAGSCPSAREGDEVEIVLDRTPFYAEAGGQLADTGRLWLDGVEVEVLDTQKPIADLVVHRARVVRGEVTVGAAMQTEVDVDRRRAISRAHTATHLIHRAFRGALGETATQAGSLNAPGRLRFDFHASGGVPQSVLGDVEDEVNAILIDDLEVRAFVTSQDEARRIGALALFGEKYGDAVRVVEVGDYARELCGGTHAARSGQLGLVKILGEASIGAGVRRVEGLVGMDAFRFLAKEHLLVSGLSELLKAQPEELPERVEGLVTRLRETEKELERIKAGAVLSAAAAVAAAATDVSGVAVAVHEVPRGTSIDDARKLAIDVRGRLESDRPGVVVVAVPADGKAQVVVAVGAAAQQRGLQAGALVRSLAPVLGGGGGGSADVAVGGGTRVEGIAEALALAPQLVAQAL
ncbi:MAG TPA: alanine--tRNA ligase [Mycobacteriales bacterium]|nr:alanine--tRNA ligase [Mycobacteriales bacterium]